VTTSLIEVGDWKFWIIFHQREKNIELEDWSNHWKNICFYLFTLYLWLPILFYFGHWNLSLATRFLKLVDSCPPKLKSHFEACGMHLSPIPEGEYI
jgi:hypothetical protein